MTKGSGGGVTPQRIVQLLSGEVASKGVRKVAEGSGLGVAAVHRYCRGIGEPTTATLKKLSEYFGVPVSWLREERYFTEDDLGDVKKWYHGLFHGKSVDYKDKEHIENKIEDTKKALKYLLKTNTDIDGLEEQDIIITLSMLYLIKLKSIIIDTKNNSDEEELDMIFKIINHFISLAKDDSIVNEILYYLKKDL